MCIPAAPSPICVLLLIRLSAECLHRCKARKKGNVLFTAVSTEAEKKKFDRSVLGYLTTAPASGNRGPHQFIDYDAMSVSWNKDVALEERQVEKGLVVASGHNIVNRKTPSDLKTYMNVAKRATNTKRSLEPHRERLQILAKSQRVSVMPFTSGTGASLGLLPSGDRLVFPVAAQAASALPRPKPVMVEGAVESVGQGAGASDGNDVDVEGDAGTIGAARDPTGGQPSGAGSSAVARVGNPMGPGVAGAVRAAGAVGSVGAAGSSQSAAAGGVPCFVAPIPACGTFRSIAPSFGPRPGLQQTWDPQLAEEAPAQVSKSTPKRKGPCCQDCGHLYTTGTYASKTYHIRSGGGKYQCLVKVDFSERVRKPDFPKRKQQKYKPCTCDLCSVSSA